MEYLSQLAFEKALQNLKEKGLYLSLFDREEFAVMSMQALTLEDKMNIKYEIGLSEGKAEGISIGEKRGISIGEKRGISIGEKRGISIGEKRGISIGEKRGEHRNQIHVAKNMLKLNIEKDIISEVTGLSLEEIEEL